MTHYHVDQSRLLNDYTTPIVRLTRNRAIKLLSNLLAVCSLSFATCKLCTAQDFRSISIKMDSITIGDEDDPLSNDEPYLILIRVRGRILNLTASPRLDPNSIQVSLAMNGHNNLGLYGDNWADEPKTYSFPLTSPRIVQDMFPNGESGWILAGVLIHLEEDGFSPVVARNLGEAARSAMESQLRAAAASGAPSVDAIMRQVLGSAVESAANQNFLRTTISLADPDDFGGIYLVGALTLGGGNVWTYAGDPTPVLQVFSGSTPSLGVPGAQLLNASAPSRTLALPFPSVRPSLPANARFNGRHTVNGTMQTWVTRF